MEDQARGMKETRIRELQTWFAERGEGCAAVVGISGSIHSAVCAALCAEALGRDRLLGILMPNGTQPDISDGYALVEHLGIRSAIINIAGAVDSLSRQLGEAEIGANWHSNDRLLSGVRAAVLAGVADACNGIVMGAFGEMCPLSKLTKEQVRSLGRELGLPRKLVEKDE